MIKEKYFAHPKGANVKYEGNAAGDNRHDSREEGSSRSLRLHRE